ncbi:MAG: arsenate reductase ArsC [Actinomycetota bacterium]|nr:arsenate reductase ArsC [Actinomycetota bacterium]
MTTPEVLFLCVHNAGRSQMAAALTERLANGRVRVRTGGSEPAAAIHPNVTAVMAEMGIDLTSAPRRFERADVEAADVVVTMGCGDECPYVPGKRYEDWVVDDPAGQDIETTRRIRDDIEKRVRALLASLPTG